MLLYCSIFNTLSGFYVEVSLCRNICQGLKTLPLKTRKLLVTSQQKHALVTIRSNKIKRKWRVMLLPKPYTPRKAFPLQQVNSIKLDTVFYMEKVGKLFRFYLQCALKITLRNISSHSLSLSDKTIICLMIPIKHGSLKEISVKFFLSQILPVEGSTNRTKKYENFMTDVSFVSILNLICQVVTFSSNKWEDKI